MPHDLAQACARSANISSSAPCDGRLGRARMQAGEARQARRPLVDLRVVLHRARAERIERDVDAVVPARQPHEVAHDLGFAHFGQRPAARRRARARRTAWRRRPRARRAAAATRPSDRARRARRSAATCAAAAASRSASPPWYSCRSRCTSFSRVHVDALAHDCTQSKAEASLSMSACVWRSVTAMIKRSSCLPLGIMPAIVAATPA